METILIAAPYMAATVSVAEAATRRWDAVVIGAGPAGSIAARALALAGRSVLLIDKALFPRDKVCGCCLSGAALDTLLRAGLGRAVESLNRTALRRLAIRRGSARAELPIDGLAVSRSALDGMLVWEAIAAGSAFIPGVVGEVCREDGAPIEPGTRGPERVVVRPIGQGPSTLDATIVVLADGIGGTALHDRPVVNPGSRIGLSAVFETQFEPGVVRMAHSRGGYVGAVRLEDGRLNLAAALDPAFVRAAGGPAGAVSEVLAESGLRPPPDLGDARWHGTPGLTRHRRRLWAPGLMILGDAAAYVEPFTGEGIGWAAASGLAGAQLILEGRPHEWPALHARLIGRRQRTCRVVAWLLRRPRLATAAVRTLSLMPLAARPALRRVQAPLLKGLA